MREDFKISCVSKKNLSQVIHKLLSLNSPLIKWCVLSFRLERDIWLDLTTYV